MLIDGVTIGFTVIETEFEVVVVTVGQATLGVIIHVITS